VRTWGCSSKVGAGHWSLWFVKRGAACLGWSVCYLWEWAHVEANGACRSKWCMRRDAADTMCAHFGVQLQCWCRPLVLSSCQKRRCMSGVFGARLYLGGSQELPRNPGDSRDPGTPFFATECIVRSGLRAGPRRDDP
jgi:hypothetical protein